MMKGVFVERTNQGKLFYSDRVLLSILPRFSREELLQWGGHGLLTSWQCLR